jgi:hypothetical protein
LEGGGIPFILDEEPAAAEEVVASRLSSSSLSFLKALSSVAFSALSGYSMRSHHWRWKDNGKK